MILLAIHGTAERRNDLMMIFFDNILIVSHLLIQIVWLVVERDEIPLGQVLHVVMKPGVE